VQWPPLLHRELLVRELAIERTRSRALRRHRVEPRELAARGPATELPPGWSFALDASC
jgi:hypothetical protein